MPVCTLTRRELLHRCRSHCIKCAGSPSGVSACTDSGCELWPMRYGYQSAQEEQTYLFRVNSKDDFYESCDRALERINGSAFTLDDVRRVAAVVPLDAHWWGAWAAALPKRGYECTGHATSGTESRNGGIVRTWIKKHLTTDQQ